ncbi:TetR/AcrR family transcriptional regulator [Paractinoplanes maris]|uniref:TetR/AcrR family transcriptional regulator n=1 Tax=Paractinoplanes maris TaxID=1734446 RepID=UPI00202077B0|nr:TetR/AcrR family transcriptional regulator [Actinoplanes maris]
MTSSDVTAIGRSRNRRGEGGRLRDEIVEAAVELLDETGDERALTLRSIARRAGIAAPSIYRHFPDQPAIMLAVVRDAFRELHETLRAAVDYAEAAPPAPLLAICHAYLDFAQARPQRYRTMFGGLWTPTPGESSVTVEDLTTLGDVGLGMLAEALADCVAAGVSSSADPAGDAVGVWLGLHGLAHQRTVTHQLPAPPDIDDRMITALAHLNC